MTTITTPTATEPTTYTSALEVLKGRQSRKIGNNTYLQVRDDSTIAVKYHETDIVTYRSDSSITLDSDGWQTYTTKERMHRYTPFRVSQSQSEWTVTTDCGEYAYADGITFYSDGTLLSGEGTPSEAAQRKALRKAINAFARRAGEQNPQVTSGDCLFCQWGAASANGCLQSHLDEDYIHGSLVYRALQWRGYPQPYAVMQFGGADMIRRAVAAYLKAALIDGRDVAAKEA